MRDSFVFYRSFKEAMSELSDSDKLTMYEAIADYSLNLTEPNLTGFPKALFTLIKPILDNGITKWSNGKKGGAPKDNKNNRFSKKESKVQPEYNQSTTELQPEYNQNTNNKDRDKDRDKDKEVDKEVDKDSQGKSKSKRFTPPTLEELKSYIASNSYSVDAERFLDYYDSNGWKVGKNAMKDWKAAVRSWHRKNIESSNTKCFSASTGNEHHSVFDNVDNSHKEKDYSERF